MTAFKKLALFIAFFTFAAGPTAFGAVVSHCADSDLTEMHSSDGSLESLCSDDHFHPISENESSKSHHVHCNPVACHYMITTQITVATHEAVTIADLTSDLSPLSIHLEALPRPPAA